MRLLHSDISIIIFDPDVDLIRVILIQCAQYEKTLTTFQFSNSVTLKMGGDGNIYIYIYIYILHCFIVHNPLHVSV